MSGSSKAPEGLKDAECEKGKLLSDGTAFTMSIFAKGNPEDYLSHVQAVLHLIGQKGLKEQCKKHMQRAEGCVYHPLSWECQMLAC